MIKLFNATEEIPVKQWKFPAGNCKEQGLLFEQKEFLVKNSTISRIISWFKGE